MSKEVIDFVAEDEAKTTNNKQNSQKNTNSNMYYTNFGCSGCLVSFITYIVITMIFLAIVNAIVGGVTINGINNLFWAAFWLSLLGIILRPFLAISVIPLIRILMFIGVFIANLILLALVQTILGTGFEIDSFMALFWASFWLTLVEIIWENIKIHIFK